VLIPSGDSPFALTGGATRADTRRMGFLIGRWLRRQSLPVQCVVFGIFALIGGVVLWAGVVTRDWRGIVAGVLLALAWPFDTFVMSRIEMRIHKRLYR
jgi:hypothetical protein